MSAMEHTMAAAETVHKTRYSGSFYFGAAIVGLIALAAGLALFWTPHDAVNALDVGSQLLPPSLRHPMGTDYLGRDVLSLVMVGAQTSISVALAAVLLGLGLGVPLGLLAAAYGGAADEAIMRMTDLVFAFPALILAILLTALLGAGALNAIVAIGIFNIPVFARLTRGPALSLWSRDYVAMARCSGKGRLLISLEHILPNILNTLIVHATVQLSLGIIAEAGLSYVGLGAQPPTPSWGRMLAESQTFIASAPWLAIFPGTAIFLTVLGLNLLGDGLRDRLDPKLMEREA